MELVSSTLPLVKDRGEWNQQTFIIRPKFEKHSHGSIDNQLEIEFPVHRDFDFVANHALGFKGKGNVDLFKFYYRLYLKNKFVIQKNRKEKKHKDQKKQEMKQQINQTDAPNTEELRNAYKTIQIKPPSQQKQLKFVRECIQTLTNQASILNKHIELPKIKQVQTKIKVVTLDSSKIPQAKTLDQQLELEELMLSRVVQAIQQSQHVSHEEVKQVREIIMRRQEQLSEIERQLQLNQILSIKKQIYDREQALKNEQNKPPGIDNPDNFNELSSIQEISLIKSMQFRSQPNVSVTEYRFNNYEDEDGEESKKDTNQTLQKKQGEETLMQEQSTEIQSILQQVRSTSIAAKGETEHSTTNDKQTNTKILPTLKFLEQAKQQIAQRSDNESSSLPQPYFQPDYEDSSNKSKMQKSISMVSHLHNKTSKTIKSSQNRSNLIQSSQSNQVSQDKKQTDPLSHDKKYTETLSLEKKQTETMRKSAYSKSPDELEYFEPQQNYYDMKFSQILQRVIEQKKQQGGEDSQLSQTLSVVESETVQRITQNLVANIINMHKNPSPVFDQPSTFNMLDIDSDDQEKATQSIPVLNEQEPVDVQRHLSYNRDIAHLDHTFKVESQISLSEKKLNEEQIANIIQQISQQLQQAQIPQDQINKQLEDVTNALLRHPINKLSQKLLRQSTIINNEPFKKIYMEETKYPLQLPKQQRKKDIDYLKFYEDNAPIKKEKSKKSQKLNDSSKRSKKSALLKLSEEERKQFLDSHKMNLQQRANSEEMDEELQFLQSIIDDEKKKKDQIFKQRQSQPLESGKNTSRDQIDINDQSEKGQNTFRSHNPPLNIDYESDQIKQGQTDINFNLRKQQKQKTDQTIQGSVSKNTPSNLASKTNPSQGNSNSRHGPQSIQSNNQQSNNNTQRTQQSKSKRTQNEKQELQSQQDYKSDQESQKIHSPNQSVEEIQAEDEQSQEEEFYEEVQQQIDEDGNEVEVVTTKRRQQTERSKKVTERSKQSKQSKQNKENQGNEENQDKVENIENQEIKEEKPQSEEQEQQQKQKTEQLQQQQQIQQQQSTNQAQNIQQQSPEETKLIKLNFQRQESNPAFSEQASTPQINQQQQAKNRTNLSDIQLKSYQQQNQSNTNTPQQNNTPLQGPPNRSKTKKTTKFEDNNSNNNTPQARLQRVKTKLSRFQEAANNDEYEYDYDWDEEEQSNKKKKITSKSSKSTLRNDVQSPSVSPQAKQQIQQAQIAKKKVYDLKQEYELIARQNLSLAELKREIEKKITQLQNPDDEAKYNIYLYEQRQKQLKNLGHSIEGLIADKRENEDACGDTIRKFHENRMRYKDVIDKDQSLKFTGQIHLDDEQQTQINTQSHLDEYMKEVQMNIQRMIQQVQLEQMRDHPEVRRECFDFDSSIIQQRKQESLQSEIVQTQAQMKIFEEPTTETQRQVNYSEIDTVISQQTDRKFEILAQKLRNLKQKNPQKFTQIVNTEIVKQELYLETTKHKYILE